MSLIERALNKMQGTRAGAPAQAVKASAPPAERSSLDVHARLPLQSETPVILPRAALRARGLLAPEHRERVMSNQYRRVKRPLIAAALGLDTPVVPMGRAIVVSSSMPHEGKTFTSLNLALNIALERELSVLLIDGDIAKRELTQALDLSDAPGLLDVVADEQRTLESCIRQTDVPGFLFLPTGAATGPAPELLTSTRMRHVFADFLKRYPSCFAIFDSPPVLLTNEARALVLVAGQVLMVVRAGYSPRQTVMDALAAIGTERPVSLLLNDYRAIGARRYEDEYGYGYGYGEGPAASPAADK